MMRGRCLAHPRSSGAPPTSLHPSCAGRWIGAGCAFAGSSRSRPTQAARARALWGKGAPCWLAEAFAVGSALAAAVVAVAGAGPSQAPVLRALAARRGLAFAADLDTLVEVAAVLADSGVPRGERVAIIARGPGAAREVVGAAARVGVALTPPGRALAAITTPEGPAAVTGRASGAAVRRAVLADAQHDLVVWVGRRPAGARAVGGLTEIEASVIGGTVSTGAVILGAERVARLLESICAIAGRAPAPVATGAVPSGGRRRSPFVPDRDATLAVLDGPPRALSDPSSKRALAPYRIPIVREVLCTSASGAERAARELQAPLVAKVASPDVPMGPDAPGVVTGILNAPQARAAYHAALRSVTGARKTSRAWRASWSESTASTARSCCAWADTARRAPWRRRSPWGCPRGARTSLAWSTRCRGAFCGATPAAGPKAIAPR